MTVEIKATIRDPAGGSDFEIWKWTCNWCGYHTIRRTRKDSTTILYCPNCYKE